MGRLSCPETVLPLLVKQFLPLLDNTLGQHTLREERMFEGESDAEPDPDLATPKGSERDISYN